MSGIWFIEFRLCEHGLVFSLKFSAVDLCWTVILCRNGCREDFGIPGAAAADYVEAALNRSSSLQQVPSSVSQEVPDFLDIQQQMQRQEQGQQQAVQEQMRQQQQQFQNQQELQQQEMQQQLAMQQQQQQQYQQRQAASGMGFPPYQQPAFGKEQQPGLCEWLTMSGYCLTQWYFAVVTACAFTCVSVSVNTMRYYAAYNATSCPAIQTCYHEQQHIVEC